MRAAVSLSILSAVVGVSPAYADRQGDAPIKAPRVLSSHHVEYTLHGDPWSQLVLAESNSPRLGVYGRLIDLPNGGCLLSVSTRAIATVARPSVGRRTVRMRPKGELMRFDHQGRHGPVNWWSGVSGDDIVAGAVQAMPTSLRTKRTRLLVYQIQVGTKADPVAEQACNAEGTRLGGAIVRRIARTLRVAAGPAMAEPPFLPIA